MLDIILDEFHFSSLWNGGVFLFTCFAAIIYFFLLPHDKRHTVWKSIFFCVGLVIVFISIASPINIIGRIESSFHIIQVILLLFISPPLLIIGMKQKPVERLITYRPVEKVLFIFTKPVVSIGLFMILFYGYHIPYVFDHARIELFWNYFYLLALFVSAILLWVSLLTSKRLDFRQAKKYIILTSFLLIPFGLMLVGTTKSLYTIYTDMGSFIASMELCLPPGESLTPEYFEMLLPVDPVREQQKGGIIFLGGQILIFSMTYLLTAMKR